MPDWNPGTKDVDAPNSGLWSKIESLRELGPDWNSYGAVEITEEAIKTAKNMTAVPSPDGGIDLELHAGGVDIEIEILPSGIVGGVYVNTVGNG